MIALLAVGIALVVFGAIVLLRFPVAAVALVAGGGATIRLSFFRVEE